jgi:hypothetical protein
MSPKQKTLSLDEVTSIRKDGSVEFMAHGGSIQNDRQGFANSDEFTGFLIQKLGAQRAGRGVRGSISRKGAYSRRAADGAELALFGDPVLESVASAGGMVAVGDKTVDLRGVRAATPEALAPASTGVVVFDAPYLKLTGIVNGAERWASDDGAMVEYRLGTGKLVFHAWKKSILFYWSMGGEISVQNTPAAFHAADIQGRYYMSVDSPCQVVKTGSSSHLHDTYLDQYEWGIFAQQPERVVVLCRAIWHNQRFRDVLTAGDGCPNYVNDPFDPGFPADWNTITTVDILSGNWTDGSPQSAAISVDFKSLTVDMSEFHRPTAHGSVVDASTISVTFPDDKTYTGHLAPNNTIRWSNGSTWTKIVNTVLDLNGNWTDGGPRIAVIFEGPSSINVDMSDFDRPTAHGSIVDASTISVTFPDDQTYTGQLVPPNTIGWSNGSTWTKTP